MYKPDGRTFRFLKNGLSRKYKLEFNMWNLTNNRLGVYFGNKSGFTGRIELNYSDYNLDIEEQKGLFLLAEIIQKINTDYPYINI